MAWETRLSLVLVTLKSMLRLLLGKVCVSNPEILGWFGDCSGNVAVLRSFDDIKIQVFCLVVWKSRMGPDGFGK